MYDETICQRALDGTPFPELLDKRGIIPGIKVDTGAKDMAGSLVRKSPKVWMVYANAWLNTAGWERVLPSGAP